MRLIDIDRLCNDLAKRWSIADKKKEELIRAVMADVVTPIVVSQPTVDAVPVGDVFALAIALNKEIEVLGLSVRAYHALSRWGCRTVGDVYRLLKSGEIKKVRNLGDKSIGEIEDGLYEYLPYLWQTEGR